MSPEDKRRLDLLEMEVKSLRRDLETQGRRTLSEVRQELTGFSESIKRHVDNVLDRIDVEKIERTLDRVARQLARADAREEAREESETRAAASRRHRTAVLAVLVPVLVAVIGLLGATLGSHVK